jgi:hypothetical protein
VSASSPGAAASPSAAPQAAASPAAGDCYLAANGADVAVGIDSPAQSCSQWQQDLAGTGLNWYPVTSLPVIGSAGSDGDTIGEACDLTDGTEELFVEDGGSMDNGNAICSSEEQNGWYSESSPGPIAQEEQSDQQQNEQASAQASAASASASASAAAAQEDQDLQQDTAGLKGEISQYAKDVATADSDYAAVKAEPLCQDGTSDQQTYDDAQNVYDDGATVYDDESQLTADEQSVASDIAALDSDGYASQYASDISAGSSADATALQDIHAGASASIQSAATAIQTKTGACS